MTTPSTPLLDRLRADDVISVAKYETARSRLSIAGKTHEPFDNLGGAVLWLIEENIVQEQDFYRLHETAAGNATAQQAVKELEGMKGEIDAKRAREARAALFSPASLTRLGIGALVVGGVIWYMLMPPSTPACDDEQVHQHMRASVFTDVSRAMSRNPMSQGEGGAAGTVMSSTFKNVEEIAYVEDTRTRGCLATWVLSPVEQPFGYSIEPSDDDGEFRITNGTQEEVKARFAQTAR